MSQPGLVTRLAAKHRVLRKANKGSMLLPAYCWLLAAQSPVPSPAQSSPITFHLHHCSSMGCASRSCLCWQPAPCCPHKPLKPQRARVPRAGGGTGPPTAFLYGDGARTLWLLEFHHWLFPVPKPAKPQSVKALFSFKILLKDGALSNQTARAESTLEAVLSCGVGVQELCLALAQGRFKPEGWLQWDISRDRGWGQRGTLSYIPP